MELISRKGIRWQMSEIIGMIIILMIGFIVLNYLSSQGLLPVLGDVIK